MGSLTLALPGKRGSSLIEKSIGNEILQAAVGIETEYSIRAHDKLVGSIFECPRRQLRPPLAITTDDHIDDAAMLVREQDDVVIVQLAEIDPFFTEVCGVNVEALGLEHQLDRLRSGAVIFYEQYAHASPFLAAWLKVGTPQRRPLESALGLSTSNH